MDHAVEPLVGVHGQLLINHSWPKPVDSALDAVFDHIEHLDKSEFTDAFVLRQRELGLSPVDF